MATLTTKEATAIEEQLGFEQQIIKKYRVCARNTQNTELQGFYNQMASSHQQNYDTLYRHLS